MNSTLQKRKNESKKPDKNSGLKRLKFMPRNLDQKYRSRIPSQLLQNNFGCILP
jgi:hypothetical protein